MTRMIAVVSCLAMVSAAEPARTMGQAASGSVGMLEAIQLPAMAQTLRGEGIPAVEVRAAVVGARNSGVAAGEIAVIFRATAATVNEHGPIDNFGAFVQQQLRAGLRGRDLADAIRAEHARRGIGKGKKLGQQGQRRGPGAAGKAHGHGRAGGVRDNAATSTVPSWVIEVAATATAIKARPAETDAILQEHGMTRETFSLRLCEVAGDPALTVAYEKARSN